MCSPSLLYCFNVTILIYLNFYPILVRIYIMNQFDFNGKSFDKIAGIYKDVRPGYGSGVYTAVAAEKKFGKNSELLEIGCGTGIATKEIADFWGAGITALEPGENLIAAKKNLCNYKNIKFVNKRFEDFESDSLFDGIFCATAFHWLDPDVKYEKAASLLKDDGILAVYWNNFGIQDTEMQIAIDNLYAEYNTHVYDKPIAEKKKCGSGWMK